MIGGGARPGGAKTCKHSDNECAELAKIAAERQLDAARAKDEVRRVPDWLAEADAMDREANSLYNMADHALDSARQYGNFKDAANQAASMAEFHTYQEKATATRAAASALRDKANGAQGRADAAEKAA